MTQPRSVFGTRDLAGFFAALPRAVRVAISVAPAVDIGRAWNFHTELQNAADTAALAGANQLDTKPGAIVPASLAAAMLLLLELEQAGEEHGQETAISNQV